MQGFKKVLVALLVVATILGTIGPVFAAPADVAGTKYEDAAVRLMALGVFKGDDKGNFNPDQPITRAEATAIVIRALGLEKSADLMKGVTKFADVNADAGLQWATGAINVAVANGIINGYPDGKFGGRDNVTYAQLAKMVLYALNYGVTVEGGIWPTAVLAKADDLGMLDDLSVVANAPITRGDAAKMLDNSLDVKSLKQTGYGDLKQYEETGATMLEKMNLDEIEGRVVEIPAVASGLDDNEVTIDITKKNGEELKDIDTETYEQLEGVDVQGLFGLEVKAWVNDKDQVVFVEKKTSDNDIYTDTVDAVTNQDVTLHVLDDNVTVDNNASIYVDNKSAKVSDLKDAYGRFVEKNNKIVFAYAFKFTNNAVVTGVDGEAVNYFTTDNTVRKLDLTKFDGYHFYNADFTSTSLDNIKKDAVLTWWKDSDDVLWLMVANKQVEGKLEKASDTKVTIDGKSYDIGSGATYSDNADEDIDTYSADNVANLLDESVVALLDLKGHVRHIRGDAKGTSGTIYGVAVDAYPTGGKYVARVFTKDGEEVEYPFEKKNDYNTLTAALTPANNYLAPVKFKLNADGEIADGEFSVVTTQVTIAEFDDKDDYFADIAATPNRYYVDDSTVIMNVDNADHEPELVAWKDIEGSGAIAANRPVAYVVADAGRDAKFVVFTSNYGTIASEDYYYGIVTAAPGLVGSNKWEITVDVFGEGEKDYILAATSDKDNVAKGDVIAFQVNADGKIKTGFDVYGIGDTGSVPSVSGKYEYVSDTVYKFDSGRKYVAFNGAQSKYYRLASDAVVYDLDGSKLGDKIAAADLDVNDKVVAVVDEDANEVRAVLLTKYAEDTSTPVTTGYALSYSGATDVITVTYNGTQLTAADNNKYAVVIGEDAYAVTAGQTIAVSVTAGKVYTAKLVELANMSNVLATNTFVAQ